MVFLHRGFSETTALTGNRMPESVFWLKHLIAPMHPSGIHLFRWCLHINLDSSAWAAVGRRHIDRSHILPFGECGNRKTNALQYKPVHIVLLASSTFGGCWKWLEDKEQGIWAAEHSKKTGGRKRSPLFLMYLLVSIQMSTWVRASGIWILLSEQAGVWKVRLMYYCTTLLLLYFLFIDGQFRFPGRQMERSPLHGCREISFPHSLHMMVVMHCFLLCLFCWS